MKRERIEEVVENVWLPDELLLIIFSQLKRGDLGACKKVSKNWERMASHPSLNWVLSVAFSIRQFELVDLNDVKLVKDLHNSGKLSYRYVVPSTGQTGYGFGFAATRGKIEV